MEELEELIKLMVEIGNEYRDEILKQFDEDISKYSLSIIVRDIEKKYGFLMKNMRLMFVEDEEAERVIQTSTVTVICTTRAIIELINSDNWEHEALRLFNLGEIDIIAKDERLYKHAKNLLKLLKILNKIVNEV